MISVASAERGQDLTASFMDLYDAQSLPLLRYLRTSSPEGADLEDLAAEVFSRAWRAWPRFHGAPDDARRWLFRIARNAAVDASRRRHGVRLLPLDEERGVEAGPAEDAAVVERLQVRAAIRRLGAADRELLGLRAAGLSHAEIAVVLGRTEAAVKMAWHRALVQLRPYLEA
jgi:RNA polymerase sigma-70 factor (ECF subfamily)